MCQAGRFQLHYIKASKDAKGNRVSQGRNESATYMSQQRFLSQSFHQTFCVHLAETKDVEWSSIFKTNIRVERGKYSSLPGYYSSTFYKSHIKYLKSINIISKGNLIKEMLLCTSSSLPDLCRENNKTTAKQRGYLQALNCFVNVISINTTFSRNPRLLMRSYNSNCCSVNVRGSF